MKVRKIGNSIVCILTLTCCSLFAAPRVELSIADMNGSPLSVIAAGMPFQAHVSVVDVDEKFSAPALEGIHHFVRGAMSSASHFTMINGKSSSRKIFSYVLRADHPGIFTLGPARIHHNNAVLESNVLKFEVVTAPRVSSPTAQGQPALLTVEVDKKKVFVGEPIEVTITLLHEPEARLHSPLAMDLEREGFVLGKQPPATTRHVVVNGKTYLGIEQKIELYSHEAGSRVIPAVNAHVQIPTRRHRSHPTFDFDDFFGRRVELYQVFSSPRAVEVVELPPSQKPAHAIGEFKNFHAQIDQGQARAGEGVVMKLSLEGSGDAKKVVFPALALPNGITSYESKSEVEDRGATWKKTFEYIIQGTEAGRYELPPQHFTYFDLKGKAYKTLSTQSLSITIVGNAYAASQKPKEKPEDTVSNKIINALPLVQDPITLSDKVPHISTNSFYYTIALFLSAIGFLYLPFFKSTPQKKACKKARSLLYVYKKRGDATKLYQLMVNLFAEHAGTAVVMNEQGVCVYVQSKGFHQAMIEKLAKDFNLLAAAAFSGGSEEKNGELFVLVQHWIEELEKIQ